MKKLLALVLALVMSMSLVTISNAAFKDADKISNKEAVDVMAAVGVLAGYDNGEFGATDTLTRAQACKIIAYLDLGGKTADAIKGTGAVFTDVKATSWYAGYVEYCAGAGYVAGVGGGKFDPEAKVTGVQFAKMLLCALGYKAEVEGYTGTDYTIAVARDANKNDLFDGLSIVTSANLTREQAAQMAFNALEATVVEYQGGTNVTTSDGTSVIVNATRNEVKESKYDYTKYDGKSDVNSDGVQQLCEKLYQDKLIKKTGEHDDFGRPATKWTYDKDTTVTASDVAVAVYAGEDFDKDVIKDLTDDGKTIVASYYNGTKITEGAREYYTKLYETKGINVELYEDDDNITVVITEAYAAQIKDIKTNDKDEVTKVTVDVYEAGYILNPSNTHKAPKTLTIDADDDEDAYDIVKGYDEDDVLVLFLKPGWDAGDADMDKVVLAADDVKTVEGKVTAISEDGKYNGWVKIDGTKYDFANEYSQNTVGLKNEGTFYLYNGYVVHFDKEANKAADEYLFVVRTGYETNKWNSKTYFAEVVFADGTAKTIELDVTEDQFNNLKDKQGIYAYTYDKGDDNYELNHKGTTAGIPATLNIQKGKTYVDGTNTANSKTVYVNVTLKDGKFDKSTVYTGYKTVPSFKSTSGYVVADKTKVAEYVFIVNGTGTVSSTDLIFVADKSISKLIEDTDLGKYFTYNAVVDGKIVEIMVEAKEVSGKYESVIKGNGPLFDSATQNSDDVYTKMTNATLNSDYKVASDSSFGKAKDDVIKIGNETFSYTDDVVLYVVDTDGDITTGSINRNYTADAGKSLDILYTQNDDDAVTTLYIVKK